MKSSYERTLVSGQNHSTCAFHGLPSITYAYSLCLTNGSDDETIETDSIELTPGDYRAD